MQRSAAWIAASCLLAAAATARADIYVWRDQYGVSHYTNDLANVPLEFRATAITVAKDWVRAEPPPEPPAQVPAAEEPATAPGPSSAAIRDDSPASVELFDAGYAAGLHAAEAPAATAVAVSSAGPVIQIMSEPPVRHDHGLLPVFGPVVVERRPSRREPGEKHPLPPVARHRSESAAGPPPLGAAGPPPFSVRH